MITDDEKRDIVKEMYNVGCFKTGNFTLRSGKTTDLYINLRNLMLYPKILNKVAELITRKIVYDVKRIPQLQEMVVAGVPYGAIPLATLVSQKIDRKMIMIRKTPKQHGLKNQIDGIDNLPKNLSSYICILIDDVITRGTSIQETLEIIHNNCELPVHSAYVFIDREEDYRNTRVLCKSVLTLSEIKRILSSLGITLKQDKKTLTFEERSQITENTTAKRLFKIMHQKKTNLIVSIDLTDLKEVCEIIDKVKNYVCAIKLHSDTWEYSKNNEMYFQKIADLSIAHYFLIFEDRKFADIGNTVKQQFCSVASNYKLLDMVTVLPIFGEGTLSALNECSDESVSYFIVSQGSSANNLFTPVYTDNCINISKKYNRNVTGLICQKRLTDDDRFVYATPGVSLTEKSDNSDQRYRTIRDAIIRDNCDVVIVGRSIVASSDVKNTALLYAVEAYKCYTEKLKTSHYPHYPHYPHHTPTPTHPPQTK